MSCPNATAPVNITNNKSQTCDLKCSYSYSYPLSVLNITNRGEYLSLRTEKSPIPPVIFNSNSYEVNEIRLYRPSLHSYGGTKADAELIINHNNTSGAGDLLVCVPISQGNSSNESASSLETIISEVSKTANSVGKQTTVSMPTFSLDKLIPSGKPFYSYNGTLPYPPCHGSYNYVVFSKEDSTIFMTSNTYNTFSKMISEQAYETAKTNKNGIFYNKKGATPGTGKKGDDIYIECLPTGSSGETQVQAPPTQEALFNLGSIQNVLNNKVFSVFFGVFLLLIILKIGSMLLNKIAAISTPAMQSGGMKKLVSSPISVFKHFRGFA